MKAVHGPVKIFVCYAREDEPLLRELEKHLRLLQRQGMIEVWYDREINPGANWEQEIKRHLHTAHIILFLVSPDFISSDYCYSIEMQQAMERHGFGKVCIIPVILRPVFWQDAPFGKIQALPADAKPVTGPGWHSREEALSSVAEGIRKIAMELRGETNTVASQPPKNVMLSALEKGRQSNALLPHKIRPRKGSLIVLLAAILFIVLFSVFALPRFNATNPPVQPSPSVMAIGSQAPSPTLEPSPTDTAQPTDTPSPVPTLPPTPGPATKAATLPFVMNCGCPSNPVQVRVTGVHIQQSFGRMTWDLTLLNVGTEKRDVTFRQIGLDLNGQLSLAQGGMVDNPVLLAPYGQSGDTGQSTITFTFVPQQGTYTLKAIMDLCPAICDSVFYNGNPFTFQ